MSSSTIVGSPDWQIFGNDFWDNCKSKIKKYDAIASQKAKSGLIDFGRYASSQAKKGAKEIVPYTMGKLNEARQYNPKRNYNWNRFWRKGYCTDGRNDGNLSLADKSAEFGKGVLALPQTVIESVPKVADYGLSFINSAIKHPIATLAATTIIGGAAVTTGGKMLPAITTLTGAYGCYRMGKGISDASQAKNDYKAKEAYREMGKGALTTGVACLGAGSALSIAKSSGLNLKKVIDKNNPAIINCIKSTPTSITESVKKLFGVASSLYTTGKATTKTCIAGINAFAYLGRILNFGIKTVLFPLKPFLWLGKHLV